MFGKPLGLFRKRESFGYFSHVIGHYPQLFV
jgi:hypothetical protein